MSVSFSLCVLVPDLCGTDDRLAGRVAASNHHLLGNEDFLCRDFYPQVAPGNHHAIALSQDLLKTGRDQGHKKDSEFEMKTIKRRRAAVSVAKTCLLIAFCIHIVRLIQTLDHLDESQI